VIRINSTINPKLGATVSGQPAASGSGSSGIRTPVVHNSGGSLAGMMGDMRDQQTAGQVLKSARITIVLEWISVQNQAMGAGF